MGHRGAVKGSSNLLTFLFSETRASLPLATSAFLSFPCVLLFLSSNCENHKPQSPSWRWQNKHCKHSFQTAVTVCSLTLPQVLGRNTASHSQQPSPARPLPVPKASHLFEIWLPSPASLCLHCYLPGCQANSCFHKEKPLCNRLGQVLRR